MSHRERSETKQQPSMLPGPAVPGCCLVSFLFLQNPSDDSNVPKSKYKADPGALHDLDGIEGRHAVTPVVAAGALANFYVGLGREG